jgi:hypothetical protein
VLKSSDRGATWTPTSLTGRAVSAIAATGGGGGAIYAATYTQGPYPQPAAFDGIHRSADGGNSWTSRSAGLETLLGTRTLVTTLIAHPDNPDALYAGTSDAGVWRSSDGGVTWIALNEGLPSLAIRALATTPGNPSTLYAATPAGVFRFNDAPALPRMNGVNALAPAGVAGRGGLAMRTPLAAPAARRLPGARPGAREPSYRLRGLRAQRLGSARACAKGAA